MGMKVITVLQPPPALPNPSITILYINKDLACHKAVTVTFAPEEITFPIPTKFHLDGVEIDTNDAEMTTFYDNLLKIFEKSDDSDTPIDTAYEEWTDHPEFNTIGLMYNNILVFPDILCNLTSDACHPRDIQLILQTIYNHVEMYFQQDIICPEFKRGWYEERLVKYLNCELNDRRFQQQQRKLQQNNV